MRSWKKAGTPAERVFLYFRAHPTTYFTPEHIAAQTGIGVASVRRTIRALERLHKIEHIETMSALNWGRPRRLYHAIRSTEDALTQLEVFQDALSASEIYAAIETFPGVKKGRSTP